MPDHAKKLWTQAPEAGPHGIPGGENAPEMRQIGGFFFARVLYGRVMRWCA
jgi:hypothetical protein